ncbi:hypothetical protein QD46_17170 [Paenibacillus polymyxa]|nr:hypothetical protein QD46_17170 [Paenibacillus polymyxa]MBG9766646.1 hypothetical protein [Paenibacillus polymyxa]UOD85721.1 hypothetical protein CUU60_11050 [Paenibacillus polymyxa ATCC 842]WEK66785.1 hypothetical protein ERJ71_21460 [Paenibacillus polymyxa]
MLLDAVKGGFIQYVEDVLFCGGGKNLKLIQPQLLLRRTHSPLLLYWSMTRRHSSRDMMLLTMRVSIQALPKVMKMATRSLTRHSKL